jgi:hypothetical protein
MVYHPPGIVVEIVGIRCCVGVHNVRHIFSAPYFFY